MHLEGFRRRHGLPSVLETYELERALAVLLAARRGDEELERGYAVTLPAECEAPLRALAGPLARRYPHVRLEWAPSADGLDLGISGPRPLVRSWLDATPGPRIRKSALAAWRLLRAARLATAPLRALPDFLIVGAPRCGTTSLYHHLSRHPHVMPAHVKEIQFFQYLFRRGTSYYRSFFPLRRTLRRADAPRGRSITGEASPTYLYGGPPAVERVRSTVPHARIVVLLRNPVSRALSHYTWSVRRGTEPLSFEEAVDREEERLAGERERERAEDGYVSTAWIDHAYLHMGIYADAVADWLAGFPREQVLVLASDDLFGRTEATTARVCGFLGLSDRPLGALPKLNPTPSVRMAPATRERLEAWFEPHNRRLEALVGVGGSWAGPPARATAR